MRWRVSGPGVAASAAALCAYAVCLLALAPATLLDAGLQLASGGRVRLAEARGTLWSGIGQVEVRDATGTKGIGRPLSWRFRPQALLYARLGLDISIAGATKPFSLTVAPSRLEIADADFDLPAAALGVAVPRLALIAPTGDLLVRIAKLTVSGREISGNTIVEWRAAGSSLVPLSPLGDYELRLDGAAGGFDLNLRTLKGPLYLEGKGTGAIAGPPVFLATARVDPQLREQLAPFLRLISVERPDGVFELQVNPSLGQARDAATGPVRR